MLGELAPWATPSNLSLGGLVALFVLAILSGLLVPLRTLQREVEAERRRADYLQQANEKQAEQIDRLLEAGRTTEAALAALQRAAERGRR